MPFSKEDKTLIKHYRLKNNYGQRRVLTEFPEKNWTEGGLENLVKKDRQGTISWKEVRRWTTKDSYNSQKHRNGRRANNRSRIPICHRKIAAFSGNIVERCQFWRVLYYLMSRRYYDFYSLLVLIHGLLITIITI